jgi:hypothetical protein
VKIIAASACAVTAALVFTAAGSAKQVTRAAVCGVPGCAKISHAALLGELLRGGERRTETPARARFYAVELTVDAGRSDSFFMYYVPSANVFAANGKRPGALVWFRASRPATRVVRAATRRLRPFPKPTRWPSELKSPGRLVR